MTKDFRGSHTVTVTPFNDDGSSIDVGRLNAFLDWQVESGVPGVIVLGTTGEFLTISDKERRLLVDATVRHSGGRYQVMVGTCAPIATPGTPIATSLSLAYCRPHPRKWMP